MAFGLTTTGFRKKRLEDIKSEVEDTFRLKLGAFITTQPASVIGNIVGVVSEREALIWEELEKNWLSLYPDTAEGVSLDGVGKFTGVRRQPASKSAVKDVCLFGVVGTVIDAGDLQASVDGNPSATFKNKSLVTLGSGVDAVQLIEFSDEPGSGTWKIQFLDEMTEDLDFDASAADVQAALRDLTHLGDVTVTGDYTAGFEVTFTGSAGLQPQELLIVPDDENLLGEDVTVTETTTGVEQGKSDFEALITGPVEALAYTLTVIDTPITGLTSILNQNDAVVGRNVEEDADYRIRRDETVSKAGAGTIEAIRSKLLDLEGVTAAFIFDNDSDIEDVNGVPAKSYECVVQGGDDQAIIDLLWVSKGGGIRPYGSTEGTAVDSQGFSHTIGFSRPEQVDIYVEIDVSHDVSGWPTDAVTRIKTALVGYVNSLPIGGDVIVYPGMIAALAAIPALIDVDIRVGIAASPTLDNNVSVGPRAVAHLESTNILVTVL